MRVATLPTLRRRNPDRVAGPGALRSSLSHAALAVEDRVVLGAGSVAEAIKWPFQRIAYAVENFLVWPIQEETAGWGHGTRAAVALAIVALAGGAVAAGVVISDPTSDGGGKVATLDHPVAAAGAVHAAKTHHEAAAPKGPVLHGTAPTFTPEAGE